MVCFELIAHRGYPAHFPENTLLGFQQAVAAGARYLEADVQLSADAVPYVFHDRDLSRLCGVAGRINRLNCQQLQRYHAHAPDQFGNRFKSLPLLRLDTLVEWLATQPQVTLFLELKRSMTQVLSPEHAVARVLSQLQPVRAQLVVISFSIKLLQLAKQQGWQRLAPVLTRWYQLRHRSVQRLAPEWLLINWQRIPANAYCPDDTPPIGLYEVSDIEQAQDLAQRGFAWIETDDIGAMLAARHALEQVTLEHTITASDRVPEVNDVAAE